MKINISHKENLTALKRASGQVIGIQKMIESEKYCIDIITQIHAAIHALYSISEKILAKHIEHCIRSTFNSRSSKEKDKKIDEMIKVIRKLHKLS